MCVIRLSNKTFRTSAVQYTFSLQLRDTQYRTRAIGEGSEKRPLTLGHSLKSQNEDYGRY